MNEYQIFMHGRSVEGILADRKTQTRRVIKNVPEDAEGFLVGVECDGNQKAYAIPLNAEANPLGDPILCPYGDVGHNLWVRETFAVDATADDLPPSEVAPGTTDRWYAADGGRVGCGVKGGFAEEQHRGKWRRSIHMPRWASRITLRVLDLRVERVQDISVEDIRAEGVRPNMPIEEMVDDEEEYVRCFRQHWKRLWDDTNSHRLEEFGWDANPWVWVVDFKRVGDGST